MTETRGNPWDDIAADLATAGNSFARRAQEKVQEDLNIAVERTGGRVIRSLPGEHPRRDKGYLREGITFEMFEGDGKVSVEGDALAVYADPLQTNLDRPIFSHLPDEMGDDWENLCAQVVTSGPGTE